MPVVAHFALGSVNPIAAGLLAVLGTTLGLACTARGRAAATRNRQIRWLAIGSCAVGGGIWLMNITALLGFDVPDSPVRYDVLTIVISAVLAVGLAAGGLFTAGTARSSGLRMLGGGLLIGLGAAATHLSTTAALRVSGEIGYDLTLFGAAILFPLLPAVLALWFALARRWGGPLVGGPVLAVSIGGTHYLGMAGIQIRLFPGGRPVSGIDPIVLVLPIALVITGTLIALVFAALQTVTEEDFAQVAPPVTRWLPQHRTGEHRSISLAMFSSSAPVPASSTVAHHEARR
jgi:NO-binding membrane sensor protein with MHYT domain